MHKTWTLVGASCTRLIKSCEAAVECNRIGVILLGRTTRPQYRRHKPHELHVCMHSWPSSYRTASMDLLWFMLSGLSVQGQECTRPMCSSCGLPIGLPDGCVYCSQYCLCNGTACNIRASTSTTCSYSCLFGGHCCLDITVVAVVGLLCWP